jgi:hypothetical protein
MLERHLLLVIRDAISTKGVSVNGVAVTAVVVVVVVVSEVAVLVVVVAVSSLPQAANDRAIRETPPARAAFAFFFSQTAANFFR